MVLMEDLDHQRKCLTLILSKQTHIFFFFLSLHYNSNSYLFVNGKEIFKFKADNKMLTFQINFVLETFVMDLAILSLVKYL